MKLGILLILKLVLMTSLTSCRAASPVKIYTGDNIEEALVRKQVPNDIIKCDSDRFKRVKCVTDGDYIKIIKKLKYCQQLEQRCDDDIWWGD